ncbi:MAG TPA: DUF6163 family protein [Bauldia sp.]|nr:DUF6163 family protein [Bauldia sp.]
MAQKDDDTPELTPIERLDRALAVFGRTMSGLMMLLGLRQWAVIIGVIAGRAGMFEEMPIAWKIATAHLAVVDLVASVGLWQRAAWGNVVWIYAALAEIAMHTVFIATFGPDYLVVALHVFTLLVFATLLIARHRAGRN